MNRFIEAGKIIVLGCDTRWRLLVTEEDDRTVVRLMPPIDPLEVLAGVEGTPLVMGTGSSVRAAISEFAVRLWRTPRLGQTFCVAVRESWGRIAAHQGWFSTASSAEHFWIGEIRRRERG